MSSTSDVRVARAFLLRVAEPPAPFLARFVAEVGPVDAARLVHHGECPARVREETQSRRHLDLAERDLAEADRYGARLVIPEDPEWPSAQLSAMVDADAHGMSHLAPPLALWVQGARRLDDLARNAVAMTGSRAATGYGEHVAAELSYHLAQHEIAVASGAGYGVDGAAHRGTLAADGDTMAVLGCALDVGYPAGHVSLLERITTQGLVVSEYPFGVPPARHRFVARNRLLAALAAAVVVVEASVRSSALNTARHAADLARPVMAVPGPITAAQSAGPHQLVQGGAHLVTGTKDVLSHLDSPGPSTTSSS
ncbi:DNA-processing protein DprA [Amycolatopsis anabasis]|uniref:DNA-processing protein DprA n=1 Tax=Amycolatopsis anabasis TaxID=1840409 RepID=UPI00131D46CD|nr:DNA-processing protein DprA [Amycolatopsis anabasis]